MIMHASVRFSCSVGSNSLWPHELEHTRLPSLSPTPRACSNSCPLNWWWHPTISYSVVLFFPCLQSFPASGSFLMSQFFASGGQSIGDFFFNFIFKLYIIVLVLPNIKMNPPQVYMCSPSWTLLPPPSPYYPSGLSQCTSPKHPGSMHDTVLEL